MIVSDVDQSKSQIAEAILGTFRKLSNDQRNAQTKIVEPRHTFRRDLSSKYHESTLKGIKILNLGQ